MIHPTAIVHSEARLDPTVIVAPYAIIDEHVADFQKYLVLADTGTRPISDCPTGVSGTLRTSES